MLAFVDEPVKPPVGVILAGGRGRRLGGEKASLILGGRPLLAYPVAAMQAALDEVAVVAKPDTVLPALPGVAVWREAPAPRHPLVGILAALRATRGRAVLVCAGDMPFVRPATLRGLAGAEAQGADAVVALGADGAGLQPLLARYEPAALARLEPAAAEGVAPMRAVVAALAPVRFVVADPVELLNVNTREDLARARALVELRRGEGQAGPGK